MKPISLKIVLRSPTLLAAAPPASNLTETLPFIPGNTIRGMLARRYLDLGGTPYDKTFHRLFTSGAVRFGFAHVAGAQPIPLSARSCKYDGGFANDGGHGMTDLLLAGSEERSCGRCGHTIDYCQGFWDPTAWRQVSVHTRIITRTAIDPTRGTARIGQLFSQRVLEEGQTFHTIMEVPNDVVPLAERLVRAPYTARLGTGTSRGQGWAEVSHTDDTTIARGLAAERFQQFKHRENTPILVVTLLSDGLFRDDYLRDATAPSLADLVPLGINPGEWNPHPARAFMDTRMIFGFDGEPLRLPRQPRLAVAAGSVFLFEAKDRFSNQTIPVDHGIGWIGDTNSEGYGWAALWHPFHLGPEGKTP